MLADKKVIRKKYKKWGNGITDTRVKQTGGNYFVHMMSGRTNTENVRLTQIRNRENSMV